MHKESFSVGDYVSVVVSDVYANAKILHIHEDGSMVIRPLNDSEKIENLNYKDEKNTR